ncbi:MULTISPECIES: DUF998 domain-containing protein [unclassified Enterococcus]|uniref:DUF998 domain-containing protein n=1 Tax=unclassified Enterococcus TaxID=2608891 RepID=UPI0015570A50|nr:MULTISPECIES: DUF998 domain-containing protein [unclassified Enterococcus]MBS7577123.1 DUF998 domain-containing protein [Enterococcus sp. MMGLQ5-2]MBS7584430.1 DUF998 domain-containing protein [Enterococcus sp. MMGLQ5-1]NPD12285.1 DUF998 domain-containing protein [Enterococcus sp. MMGLQ5-1]NPD36957.1 DUF998 domain-containing protein [Enterococcus sp. MMGLQ5-2]
MVNKKNLGFYLMIITITSEIILPFILGSFYPEFNQWSNLISDFGASGSPVQNTFKLWEIIDGSLLIIAASAFYFRFKSTSESLAKLLTVLIVLYAIGDCIITGIADRVQSAKPTIMGQIHDYASGISLIAIFLGILVLIILYHFEDNQLMTRAFIIILILAGLTMLLFAAPRLPLINQLHLPYRGLTQKILLYLLFSPFFFTSIQALKNRNWSAI